MHHGQSHQSNSMSGATKKKDPAHQHPGTHPPLELLTGCRPGSGGTLEQCAKNTTEVKCKDPCRWVSPAGTQHPADNDCVCMPSHGSDFLQGECDLARTQVKCAQMKSPSGGGCTWGAKTSHPTMAPTMAPKHKSGMSDTTIGLIIGGSMLAVFGIVVLILAIRGKPMKKSR
jgi:hypothetical protein